MLFILSEIVREMERILFKDGWNFHVHDVMDEMRLISLGAFDEGMDGWREERENDGMGCDALLAFKLHSSDEWVWTIYGLCIQSRQTI